MQNATGTIEKLHTKTGMGKKGPWTRYSAVIGGEWYNFGFQAPGVAEGDTVNVTFDVDQYGNQVKAHQVIEGGTNLQAVPAAPAAQAAPANKNRVSTEVSINVGHAINVATSIVAANVNTMEAVSDSDIADRVFELLPKVYTMAQAARESAMTGTLAVRNTETKASTNKTLEDALMEEL